MTPEEDAEKEFYASIGDMVVAWAHLEAAVDLLINGILNGDKEGKLGKRPRTLTDKLKFLRRAFRDLFDNDEGLRDALEFSKAVKVLGKFRHGVIHGAMAEMVDARGEAQLIRFLEKDGVLERTFTMVDAVSIRQNAREMDRLAQNAFQFVQSASTPNV